jgi:predicted AlkP superfamily phosphohydrolase/phosphomutase
VSKLIVFGIDGGSLKLIEQWRKELPNFQKIMEGGVFGELESTIPPVTCPAWPCMFTGKNPGKLGMYEFLNLQFAEEGGFKPFSSSDYHASSLWKILNDYGRKVGLLNVPMTFPPHEINSFMVCGLGTPRTAKYTYPPQLKNTLSEVVGGYDVFPVVILTRHDREKEYLKLFNEVLNKRVKAARYLMSSFPWDLFICVFQVSDVVQHYFWHHMDKSHPRHAADNKYKNVIKDFYKRIDGAIGSLISEVPKDTNILIVSDHGFGPFHGVFLLNKWLEGNGFLKFKDSVYRRRINNFLTKVKGFLFARLSLRLIRLVANIVPQRLAHGLFARVEKDRTMEIARSIDWAQTKAYSLGSLGKIFINLKGREPNGIVEPGREYERLRDEIIEKLSKLVNPETGERADFQIFKKEEIYHGQYAHLAPDISIVADKYVPVISRGGPLWDKPPGPISGTHARQGVFMAYGPDIKKEGLKLAGLKIYDITPTVLYTFGSPIPKDMDGRVLSEIFAPDSELAKKSVVYEEMGERERIKSRISRLKTSGNV